MNFNNYMQSEYGSKVMPCYKDTYSSVYDIDTEDFCKDIAEGRGKGVFKG